jgi:hypothetical protein
MGEAQGQSARKRAADFAIRDADRNRVLVWRGVLRWMRKAAEVLLLVVRAGDELGPLLERELELDSCLHALSVSDRVRLTRLLQLP